MLNATISIAAYARNTLAIGLFALVFSSSLMASATPAAYVEAAIEQVRLAGEGKLRVLGFEIYTARLWVGAGFKPEQFSAHGFALEINYLRNFDNVDIAKRSVKEMRRVATVSDAQAAAWLETMVDVFPDVKKGDRLTGIHLSDGSARFVMNGRVLKDIPDRDFSQAFFAIWLSEKSSEPRLRQQLFSQLEGRP